MSKRLLHKTLVTHIKYHIELLREEQANKELEQKTRIFWTVQLSLLELSSYTLILLFNRLQSDGAYVKNKYTKKFENLKLFSLDEDERQCLATHLALQLCGIDE